MQEEGKRYHLTSTVFRRLEVSEEDGEEILNLHEGDAFI